VLDDPPVEVGREVCGGLSTASSLFLPAIATSASSSSPRFERVAPIVSSTEASTSGGRGTPGA
jgi:hypothetical protein